MGVFQFAYLMLSIQVRFGSMKVLTSIPIQQIPDNYSALIFSKLNPNKTKLIKSIEEGADLCRGRGTNKKHLRIFIFSKMKSKSTPMLPSCGKTAGLMWSDPAWALQIKLTSTTVSNQQVTDSPSTAFIWVYSIHYAYLICFQQLFYKRLGTDPATKKDALLWAGKHLMHLVDQVSHYNPYV